jgi:hypothetical protein
MPCVRQCNNLQVDSDVSTDLICVARFEVSRADVEDSGCLGFTLNIRFSDCICF